MSLYTDLDVFLDNLSNKTSNTQLTKKDYFVKTTRGKVPLETYQMNKKISDKFITKFIEVVKANKDYLKRFYKLSLEVDENLIHFGKNVEPMDTKVINNNKLSKVKNVIRNMHMFGILRDTHSGIDNVHTYYVVMEDLFKHNIIDYKILSPSSRYYIENGRFGSVLSSLYFRASILNPYLVYSLNVNLLKGKKVFTPTLGWSSYAYGFSESGIEEYVGTDVIPSVCKKTDKFIKKYYPNVEKHIFCQPSEDLLKNTQFINAYSNHFDVVFFSPPYYRLELYEGKKQSTNRYKTYDEWLRKYWENTVKLCYKVLNKGGKMCYIVSGYGSETINEQYDLVKDMNEITQQYFTLKYNLPMYNKNVNVTKHKEPSERILVFYAN